MHLPSCIVLSASLCFLPGAGDSSAAETVTVLGAAADTTIFSESAQLSSGKGDSVFAGRTTHEGIRRGLLRFDPAGIPADAVITSVKLILFVNKAPDIDPVPIRLHRVLARWGEGASASGGGTGAPAQCGDATWTHSVFSPGAGCASAAVAWTGSGGDIAATVSAEAAIGGIGTYSWSSPGMVSDVTGWLRSPGSNHGWLLAGDEENLKTARRFSSREWLGPSSRPKLEITWTPDPYAAWISGFTSLTTGADRLPDADPDGDGVDNLSEFAFNGQPDSGENPGTFIAARTGDQPVLIVPVRGLPAFSGIAGLQSDSTDGVTYLVRASGDLEDYSSQAVVELPVFPLPPDAPPLPPGWSYRAFTAAGTFTRVFLQASAIRAAPGMPPAHP